MSFSTTHEFPLAALVGQERLKTALLLCAVNPGVGGVLIRGDKGSAKSTAARGLAGVMAPIERVVGCLYNCAPPEPSPGCEVCNGARRSLEMIAVPFVNLPLGASEDRVLGSLDFERALKDGRKAFQPGLLASAHRGILYIDEVNLLPDHLVDVLLDTAAMGINRVQREGLSLQHPARIALVGTMNQEEGELRPQLLDRFGMMVEVRAPLEPGLRTEIVRRRLAWEADPRGFCEQWNPGQLRLREQVARAQALLPNVVIADGLLVLISELCCSQGVTSLRADVVMNKAARSLAALNGRTHVSADDLAQAAMLVLPHRRRTKPFERPGLDEHEVEEFLSKARSTAPTEQRRHGGDGNGNSAAARGRGPAEARGGAADADGAALTGHGAAIPADGESLVADGTAVPANGPSASADGPASAADGAAASADGTAVAADGTAAAADGTAVPANGAAAPADGAAVAADRAAGRADGITAPASGAGVPADGAAEAAKQVFAPGAIGTARRIELRSEAIGLGVVGRRSVSLESRRGRDVRAVPDERPTDLAVTATLHHSLLRTGGLASDGRLEVTRADLHQRVKAGRQGNLILFVVDSSGSMAALRRMQMVKATVLALLRDAYQRRDEVGVIAFGGTEAKVLLPPTRSVDTAEGQLRELPTGGRTPLAHALRLANELISRPSGAARPEPLLIILSDGRANVALDEQGDPWEQSLECARVLSRRRTAALVLDTEAGYIRMGRARALAEALGAQCLSVEEFNSESLSLTIRGLP
jgi:magnesium chelatase subunit D